MKFHWDCLYDWLLGKGLEKGTDIALETPAKQKISYQELDSQVRKLQTRLQEFRLKKNAHILCVTQKSVAQLELYLCCLKAGYVFVPVDYHSTSEEIAFYIQNAQPSLIVSDPQIELNTDIPQLHLDADGKGSLVDGLEDYNEDYSPSKVSSNDCAVMFYSISHGKSVGIPLSHGNIIANNKILFRIWRFDQRNKDVLLHVLPLYYMPGLLIGPHLAMLNGGKIILCPRFDAEQCVSLLPHTTVLMGVPTIFHRLNQVDKLKPSQCRKIRMFISGSAALPRDVFETFKKKTGHSILNRYGTTETGIITSNPNTSDDLTDTVGFVLPGIKARIVDDNGLDVTQTGRSGVLQVAGDSVFGGYWHRDDLNRQHFSDDRYFITADIATMDRDQRIRLIGRAQEAITSGGRSIHPVEIEMQLSQMDEVQSAIVVGVPDDDMGEIPVAFVKMQEPAEFNPVFVKKAEEMFLGTLVGFKRPREILLIDEWPLADSGKPDREKLVQKYQEQLHPAP